MDERRPHSPNCFAEGLGKQIADSAGCGEEKNYSLYVVGIPPDFTTNGLWNLFSECGKVKKVNLLPLKQVGWPKVGFVEFGTMPEIVKALQMYQNFKIGDYSIRASIARDRSEREKANKLQSAILKDIDLGEYVEKSIEQSSQKAGKRFEKNTPQKMVNGEGKTKPCAVCKILCHPTCSQCKSVYYCGSTCQRKHWQEHKKVCKGTQQQLAVNVQDSVISETMSNSSEGLAVEVDSMLVKSVETHMKSIATSTKGAVISTKAGAKIYDCPPSVQPGKTMPVVLVDILPPGDFYFQLALNKDSVLSHLVHAMTELYSQGGGIDAVTVEKGGIYACQYSADQQWYRAYVQSISDNKLKCNVWYVDFGNCEDVDVKNLVHLKDKFVQIPPHSVRCKLYKCSGIEYSRISSLVARHLETTDVEIKVFAIKESIAEVEMFATFGQGRVSLNRILFNLFGQQKQAFEEPRIVTDKQAFEEPRIVTDRQAIEEPRIVTNQTVIEKSLGIQDKQKPGNDNLQKESMPSKVGGRGREVLRSPMKTNLSSIFQKSKIRQEKVTESFVIKIPNVQIPAGQFEAVITHVTGIEDLSCAPLGPIYESLQQIQDELSAYCDNNFAQSCFEKEKICAAKSSTGPGWYRAEMISQASESEIMLLFIDYGNKEKVKISEICEFPNVKKFWQLKRVAVTFKLKDCITGSESFNQECLNLLKQCENQSVTAEVDLNSDDRPLPITIYVDEILTVNEYICQLKKSFEKEEPTQNEVKLEEELPDKDNYVKEEENIIEMKAIPDLTLDSIEIGSEGEILITHLENPGDFTFQLFSQSLADLGDLSAKMSDIYEKPDVGKESFPIVIGNFYSVKYDLDSMWYRAQVTSSSEENEAFSVTFIDYGNVETVGRQAIKPLLDDFCSLSIQGLKGKLYGCCPGKDENWSQESIATMQSLQNQNLSVVFRGITEQKEIMLDILGDSQTVSEVLISSGYVEPIITKGGVKKENKSHPQTEEISVKYSSSEDTSVASNKDSASLPPLSTNMQSNVEMSDFKKDSASLPPLSTNVQSNVEMSDFKKDSASLPPLSTIVQGSVEMTASKNDSAFLPPLSTNVQSNVEMSDLKNDSASLPPLSTNVQSCVEMFYSKKDSQSPPPLSSDVQCSVEITDSKKDSVSPPPLSTDVQCSVEISDSKKDSVSSPPLSTDMQRSVKMSDGTLSPKDGDVLRDSHVPDLTSGLVSGTNGQVEKMQSSKILQVEPKLGEEMSVLIVHADSPSDFFCQIITQDLAEIIQRLETLNLQCCQNTNAKLDYFTMGDYCAACASDSRWYRAKVLAVDEDRRECIVCYIDYGNEETVPFKQLRNLSDEFVSIRAQAVRCSLKGCFPTDKDWSVQCVGVMTSLVNQECKVIFDKSDENEYDVDLFLAEGMTLNDYMVEQGFATKERKNTELAEKIDTQPKEVEGKESPSTSNAAAASPKQELQEEYVSCATESCVNERDVPDSTTSTLKEGDEIKLQLQNVVSPAQMRARVICEGKNAFIIRCRMFGIEPADAGASWTEESSRTIMMFASESLDARVIQAEKDEHGLIYKLYIPTLINALILAGLGLSCM